MADSKEPKPTKQTKPRKTQAVTVWGSIERILVLSMEKGFFIPCLLTIIIVFGFWRMSSADIKQVLIYTIGVLSNFTWAVGLFAVLVILLRIYKLKQENPVSPQQIVQQSQQKLLELETSKSAEAANTKKDSKVAQQVEKGK